MNRTGTGLLLASLLALLPLASSCGSSEAISLSVSSDSLDFGSVALGESAELSVTLTNSGATSAQVEEPVLTGDGS